MSYNYPPEEPTPDHLEDTNPIRITHLDDTNPIRPVLERGRLPAWRRLVGAFSLIGALALTVATAALLLTPPNDSTQPIPQPTDTNPLIETLPTEITQIDAPPTQVSDVQPFIVSEIMPTVDPSVIGALLNTPLQSFTAQQDAQDITIMRNNYEPFTFVPDRPRNEVITYEVQAGDTIFGIAERFGLQPESIAWANERSIIGGLRPGRRINILPADGAYIQVTNEITIAEIASRFRVEPFVIIDSEYNDFFGAEPDTVLPSGTWVVVPGGQAEQITWSAPVTRTGSNAQSGGAGAQISFGAGEPGTCGLVDNPGNTTGWVRPLSGYTWIRGFTSFHTGVDLAAPTGTPVVAANSGTVIFAGGSNYGYGLAVVLAHGPFTTVYGHLSQYNVRCRAAVSAGQVIGLVGSTGDSTGPHLHFEIRYNDIPTDPVGTMPF
jgi:murein DD-endopeptidase MepM/ murein hydrolase activator NlpD